MQQSRSISPVMVKEALQQTRRAFVYVALFSAALNILMLGVPLYSLQVLDRVISSRSMETLTMLTVIAVAVFFCVGLFHAVRSFVLTRIGEWLDRELGPTLLKASVMRSALRNEPSGGGQNLRDLLNVRNFIAGPGVTALFDAPFSLLFWAVIMLIHPVLGLLTFLGAMALLVLATLTELTTRKPLRIAGQMQIKNMNSAEAATRNAEVIESMGMLDHVVHHWQKQNAQVQEMHGSAINRSNVITAASRILRLVLQIMVIGFGAYFAINNEITVGGMIACSILTGRALAPFEAAIGSWKSMIGAREAYRRLNVSLEKLTDDRGTMPLPAPEGRLEADKLIFHIPGAAKPIIRGISFRLEPGESVGIIGPSAAGKSTLAKLIVGIWKPSAGVIRLDGADVYKWNRADFGQYVGYLPQDVELFDGSVAQNIARMREDFSPEAVIGAAQWAGVHEMILQLPKGYETEIGEFGHLLSPGQRQRIGLARALYGKPRLLVLDEPNSNLDGQGERSLVKAIQVAKQHRITTVLVAHRPSIVSGLDKIIMLREGLIEAFGPRDEVLSKYTRGNVPQPQAVNIAGGQG